MPFHNMFFKVLSRDTFDHEMEVAVGFVKKYWKGLSNPILLELPNGDEKKIKWIQKNDGSVWFNEGWKSVVELCGIKFNYFLVFKYNGNSKFELSVFDKSCSEIDYSTSITVHHNHIEEHHHQAANRNPNHGHDHGDDNDSIEIIDGIGKQEKFRRRRAGVGRKRLAKVERDLEIGPRNYNKELFGVMKRAQALCKNSKYPCFIQEMQITYISQDVLGIPVNFCREHLFGLKGKAKIGVKGNMKWEVELRFCGERATFNYGWKNVCRNYELKVGDLCVFEMIEVTPLSFNIEVFKAKEETITPSHQNLLQDHQGLTQPKKVEGQNGQSGKRKRGTDDGTSMRILDRTPNMQVNQFDIQMKYYHLSGATMYLPNGFLRSHRKCVGKYVNLKAGEISRPVKLLSRGAFSEGWLGFTRDCKLKIGDICTFNLVDDQNICFEVSVTKSKE